MKKLICLGAGALLLSGCAITPLPPGPTPAGSTARTCVVQDLTGRTWHWTGTNQPCAQAMQSCRQWHFNRPNIRNWKCSIKQVY